MSSIDYSIASDFTNGISLSVLGDEIEADETITKTLIKLGKFGDVVRIEFDFALSGAEQTALDAVVAAHVRDPAEDGIDVKGNGRIYKKAGSDAVYWKPDGGTEVNLTVPNMGTTSAAASDKVSSSSSSFYHVDGMTVSAPTDAKYEIRFTSSIETSSNSTVVEIVFYKNGSEISGPILYCGDRSAIYPASLSSVQILSSGDVIKVYARKSDGSGKYEIYYRQLILLQLA